MLLVASALCTLSRRRMRRRATQLSLSLQSGGGGVHSRAFVMFRRLLFVISFCLCLRVAFFYLLPGLRVLSSQQHKYTMVAGPVHYK